MYQPKVPQNQSREISIAWRNLGFDVITFRKGIAAAFFGEEEPILQNLNGSFSMHSLNGLMGPSGAGKTTLLNALNSRERCGLTVHSEIYLNATTTGKGEVESYFIQQHVHETIISCMTVGQIFRYAFQFKNGLAHGSDLMEQHIGSIMKQLMLPSAMLDRPFSSCSGGEQKRVAIGQELMSLATPSFLFLDEPTTGLDSVCALEVVSCLKHLASQHLITVIASIHQPADELLAQFDHIYVLAKGGICIYADHPGKIEAVLMQQLGITVPDSQYPIDTLIEIACNRFDSSTVKLAKHYQAIEFQNVTKALPQLRLLPNGLPSSSKAFSFVDFLLQLKRLIQVILISGRRQFVNQLLFYAAIFFILSTIFSHEMVKPSGCVSKDVFHNETCFKELDETSQLTENISYLCITLMFAGYIILSSTTFVFGDTIKALKNEHRNRWYSISVFDLAVNCFSILQVAIYTLVMEACIYFFIGQHTAFEPKVNVKIFTYYILCLYIFLLYNQNYGKLVSILFVGSVEITIVASLITYTLFIAVNDFFLISDEVSRWSFVLWAELVGHRYFTKTLLYIFYGIARCDSKRESSLVLKKYYIDPDRIWLYLVRVAYHITIFYVVSFVIMKLHFSGSISVQSLLWRLKRGGKNSNNKASMDSGSTCLKINFEQLIDKNQNENETLSRIDHISQHSPASELTTGNVNQTLLAWKNLSLYASKSWSENVSSRNRTDLILRNLNGSLRFRSLTALMGTSGAGKTSLLRVLNGQLKSLLGEGTVFYLSNYIPIRTCFITQEVSDHLMRGLTAKESLIFSSKLKNKDQREVDHEQVALKWLAELDIGETAHTKVDNCSGGERKRLALAQELTSIEMPNFICLDEPTSGLDSNSAKVVVSCLRKLVKLHNITIICSIHQPSTELLFLFDQLYVLARGGVCIYSGLPKEIATNLRQHFSGANTKLAIDQLIKHSCSDHQDDTVQRLVKDSNEAFAHSLADIRSRTFESVEGVAPNSIRFSLDHVSVLLHRYALHIRSHLLMEIAGFFFLTIFYAYFLRVLFDPEIALASGCLDIYGNVESSCTLSAVDSHNLEDMLTNYKYNFFMSGLFLIVVVAESALIFMSEISQFANEHRNGWYSAGAFYVMKNVAEVALRIPMVMTYIYICDIYEEVKPAIYWHLVLIQLLCIIAFQGFAHVFVLLSNGSLKRLFTTTVGVCLLLIFIGNVYIQYARLHYVYQFLSNFSIIRFTFEALMLLQYGFGRCAAQTEVQVILYWMSLSEQDYRKCLQMLAFHVVLYRVVAFWLLTRCVSQDRNRRHRVKRICEHVDKLQASADATTSISAL